MRHRFVNSWSLPCVSHWCRLAAMVSGIAWDFAVATNHHIV